MRDRHLGPNLLVGASLVATMAAALGEQLLVVDERPRFRGYDPPKLRTLPIARRVLMGDLQESDEPPRKHRKFRHNRRG